MEKYSWLRLYVLLFVSFWWWHNSAAQTTEPTSPSVKVDSVNTVKTSKPWEFGITGSLVFSVIEGDLTEGHSYVADFAAGVYGDMEIFYPLGLKLELYYAGLGTGFASIGDSRLHFNYLVTTAMFTYEFRPLLQFAVGPYIGFLLTAKDQGDDFKENITDLVNPLDVGVKIGIYYQAGRVFGLGVAFTRGFINTQRGERVGSFKQYNQSVMFTTTFNLNELINGN